MSGANITSSMDIRDGIGQLCAQNTVCAATLDEYLTNKEWNREKGRRLRSQLATLFMDERCTEDVCTHIGPMMLSVVGTASVMAGTSHDAHTRFSVALSKALVLCPNIRRAAATYLRAKPFLQELHETDEPRSKKSKKSRQKTPAERELTRAAWRLASVFRSDVPLYMAWARVLDHTQSLDDQTRWFAVATVATVMGMSTRQRDAYLSSHFSDRQKHDLLIEYNTYVQTSPHSLTLTSSQSSSELSSVTSDLHENVVSVEGVLLPRNSATIQDTSTCLVLVESTRRTLHHLALAVTSGQPVLIQGRAGCGKTSVIEHLARATGQKLVKIQLGDQSDSKALLGTYRCTDVPGEFVWQPGVLTQAVTGGLWVLLEDIDTAPMDVLSTLLPLLETSTLSIPGHGDTIKAVPGFQIFSTQRLLPGYGGLHTRAYHNPLLTKAWTVVNMHPLSRPELHKIICSRFSKLEKISTRLVNIYFVIAGREGCSTAINDDETVTNDDITEMADIRKLLSHEGRLLSTRDLMSWCSRVELDFTHGATNTGYEILLEALDCFSGFVSRASKRLSIAEAIAARLNVTRLNAEYYCTRYKPVVEITEDSIKIGRVQLARDSSVSKQRALTSSRPFSFTRPASCLLECVGVCVNRAEPVLLVGETGTGKTSAVQYLASLLGQRLRVINLNQQSDSADLLGGFKPVDLRHVVRPFREDFEALFCETFSRKDNMKFLGHIQTCYVKRRWLDLFTLMDHTITSALKKQHPGVGAGNKWKQLSVRLHRLKLKIKQTENALAFTFIEGTLVSALRNGDWVLLDEVNLASADTLQCLSGLLESASGSVLLSERGDTEPIERHPNFRLFACMNPATDVGKKDLPAGIRNRFTEFFVDELTEPHDLMILISDYLTVLSLTPKHIEGMMRFYLAVRQLAVNQLTDGTGHRPHFSLRTLCRALSYCAMNPCISVMRSLYEGFCMSFLTQLDRSSHALVQSLVTRHILTKTEVKAILNQPLPEPRPRQPHSQETDTQLAARTHTLVEGYWVRIGDRPVTVPQEYILTPAVCMNLRDLARVVSHGSHPVLLQGETSVGKTSLVTWLAGATGNHCVRVNNHEHTDLQEYVGCYTPDSCGKLVFREGVLVEAMRKGYWIILDELNLAPSDVLEALNRLLDDNRELFVSETQEMITAHPQFMLFATQNPPGHYGGRKMLSRAFRNRFIELHFDEIPSGELETILHKRCSIPTSYAKRLVAVMLELQTRRRGSGVFAGKQGFMTLRDLFRWADRYHQDLDTDTVTQFYDWDQHMADHGYMLLAGRVRCEEEVKVVRLTLEKHLKRTVNPQRLFSLNADTSPTTRRLLQLATGQTVAQFGHLVWTYDMRRLAVLLGAAIAFREPALLVGETGCGKTTLCQLYAALRDARLEYISCHLHTESADFLGGLRPIRSHQQKDDQNQRLFEWQDGPLVSAMTRGHMFLVDEISLADDSVLERLNSVLEPERSLLVAEKGAGDGGEVECIVAHEGFHLLATMNPGGDYGKKELSPALRNRMTEIWCPQLTSHPDLVDIIEHNLDPGVYLNNREDGTSGVGEMMVAFVEWFTTSDAGKRSTVSIRDILAWVNFINTCSTLLPPHTTPGSHKPAPTPTTRPGGARLDTGVAYIHGACLVFLDAIGSGSSRLDLSPRDLHRSCVHFLLAQVTTVTHVAYDQSTLGMLRQGVDDATSEVVVTPQVIVTQDAFTVTPFSIPTGPETPVSSLHNYTLTAPTPCANSQRILRALQLPRPLLLEGSPGVGKTSLVTAIARASGHRLVRINLSEQTDVSDLFGADLPLEGGQAGQFVWRDGPLLRALKAGDWVVLDELNLASQSVLEGLNACLDHRAEVFVPELGRAFTVARDKTRIFACQNPLMQGGGRKGLPRSFLNRFTQVYVEPMVSGDLLFILSAMYPSIPHRILDDMVAFNAKVGAEWGVRGGGWEFNLRDLFRWCDLMLSSQTKHDPSEYVSLIYEDRMRSAAEKTKVIELYTQMHPDHTAHLDHGRDASVTSSTLQVGHSFLARRRQNESTNAGHRAGHVALLHHDLRPLESVMKCVEMSWMTIVVGVGNCGKSSVVRVLSELTGNPLNVLAMNSAMDTTELLGGFEQADLARQLEELVGTVESLVRRHNIECLLRGDAIERVKQMEGLCEGYRASSQGCTVLSDMEEVASIGRRLEVTRKVMMALKDAPGMDSQFLDETSSCSEKIAAMGGGMKGSNSGCHGGSFEWVDSVLVKALKQGHWLLVDNVNLCSASVLDRLNALLEPGGVLQINERGVIDGDIPSVRPHENFRLFLAMDPQHGEISRAMRNRGVEICLLSDGDNSYSNADLHKMLECISSLSHAIHAALIDLHRRLRDLAPTNQRPDLADLLRVGRLVQQETEHDGSVLSAIKSAAKTVYMSNLSSFLSTTILDEELDSVLTTVHPSSRVRLPHIADHCLDARLTGVVTILHHITNALQHVIDHRDHSLPLNPTSLTRTVASLYLQHLPADRWQLGHEWLTHVTGELYPDGSGGDVGETLRGCGGLLGKLRDGLGVSPVYGDWGRSTVDVVKSATQDLGWIRSMCLDLRWNLQAMNKVIECVTRGEGEERGDAVREELNTVYNRLILLQDLVSLRHFTDTWIAQQTATETPLYISYVHHTKKIGDQKKLTHGQLSLVHLYPLYARLLADLRDITETCALLSDLSLTQLRERLLWLSRFLIVCQQQTPTTLSPQLSLYWQWLHKHLIKPLSAHHGFQLSPELCVIVKNIVSIFTGDEKIYRMLSLVYKSWPHPACLLDQQEAEKFLSIVAGDDRLVTPGQIDPPTFSGPSNETEEMETDESNVAKRPRTKSAPNELAVRLWPLVDLVALKVERKVTGDIMRGDRDNLAQYWSHVEKMGAPMTAGHLSVLHAYMESEYSEKGLSPLLTSFFHRLWSSTATLHVSTWLEAGSAATLTTSDRDEDDDDAIIDPCDLQGPGLLQHCPLAKIAFTLLGHDDHNKKKSDLSGVCLGNHLQMAQVFSGFAEILWTNTPAFSEFYDNLSVEREALKAVITYTVNLVVDAVTHDAEATGGASEISRVQLDGGVPAVRDGLNRCLQGNIDGTVLTLLDDCLEYLGGDSGVTQTGLNVDTKRVLDEVKSVSGKGLRDASQTGVLIDGGKRFGGNNAEVGQKPDGEYNCSSKAETQSTKKNSETERVVSDDPVTNDILDRRDNVVSGDLRDYVAMGGTYARVGLFLSSVLAPRQPVDPVEKRAERLRLVTQQLEDVVTQLSVHRHLYYVATGCDQLSVHRSCLHPTVLSLLQSQLDLEAKKRGLEQKQAYRPTPPQYNELKTCLQSYQTTTGEIHKVLRLTANLTSANEALRSGVIPPNLGQLLTEEQSWQTTQHKFVGHVESEFPLYRDLWQWFVVGVCLTQHGLRVLAAHVRAVYNRMTIARGLTYKDSHLERVVLTLAKLPSVSTCTPHLHAVVAQLCDDSVFSLIDNALATENARHYPALLIACLDWLNIHIRVAGRIDAVVMETANSVVGRFVHLWREQDERRRQKELEKESLYRISYCDDLTEEEQEEEDFVKSFPSYDEDFSDIVTVDNLNKTVTKRDIQKTKEHKPQDVISLDDMATVIDLHSRIYSQNTRTDWFNVSQSENATSDWLKPFLIGYGLASAIARKSAHMLESSLDANLISSHLVSNAVHIATVTHSPSDSVFQLADDALYDIYHHSNVHEVVKCRPIVTQYRARVDELLAEWPDHPNLVQINDVIDKLFSMPITSPVMKFLAGLELLIEKSQDWENNSARHVSVAAHLREVSLLIVEWRKMELQFWKNALDTEAMKARVGASKWWFHVHDIVGSFMNSGDAVTGEADMITSLKQFMETSSLVEFTTRLHYLHVFHCQLANMKLPQKQGVLLNVLWNLVQFYSQFTPDITQELANKRQPIEKQLKDYVKIARWNDINYWALRQTTLRAHRTIFKHVREYRKILDGPVKDLLIDQNTNEPSTNDLSNSNDQATTKDHSTSNDQSSKKDHLTSKDHSSTNGHSITTDQSSPDSTVQKSPWLANLERYTTDCRAGRQLCRNHDLVEIEGIDQWPLLSRVSTLTTKLYTHYTGLVKQLNYTEVTAGLDQFIGDMIEGISELQTLKVNQDAEKEKQKKEAKHIVVRKRKGLSDLFRYLALLGLSYKKGLLHERSDVQNSEESEMLAEIWSDCPMYYYKCLLRLSKFIVAATHPSKEIGVSNLERFRGFCHLLMEQVIGQRERLTEHARNHKRIMELVTSLKRITSRPHSLPLRRRAVTFVDDLRSVLVSVEEALSQLLLVVHACPAHPSDDVSTLTTTSPIPASNRPAICDLKHGGHAWTTLVENIQGVISTSQNLGHSLHKLGLTNAYFTRHDVLQLTTTIQELPPMVVKLEGMTSLFRDPRTQELSSLGDVLPFLCDEINAFQRAFGSWFSELEHTPTVCDSVHTDAIRMDPGDDHETLDPDSCRGNGSKSPRDSRIPENVSEMGDNSTDVEDCGPYRSDSFGKKVEDLISGVLLTVQNMVKSRGTTDPDKNSPEESDMKTMDGTGQTEDDMLEGCMKRLEAELPAQVTWLTATNIISKLEDLFSLSTTSTRESSPLTHDRLQKLLALAVPFMDVYVELSQFILVQSLSSHRTTSKLLSVLLNVFTELCSKGFCLPQEISDELMGEGATEFGDIEGGGIGEGEGMKNVSDQLENEDQIEEGKRPEDWKKEEQEDQPDVESEKNAIEMSKDFDAKVQDLGDVDKKSDDGNEGDENAEDDIEKEMGDVDDEEERLDEQMWGSDDEGDTTDKDKDEKGTGEGKDSESELVAKGENEDENKSEKKKGEKDDDGGDENQDDIDPNEQAIDEGEYDDERVDPRHGQTEGGDEPEAMDLPEDLALDEGEKGGEEEEECGEDPTDMDTNEPGIEEEETDLGDTKDESEQQPEGDAKDGEDASKGDEGQEDEVKGNEEGDQEGDDLEEKGDNPEEPQMDETNGADGFTAPEEPRAKESEKTDADDAPSAEHYGKTSNDSAEVEQSQTAQDTAGIEAQNETDENEGQGMATSEDMVGHESSRSDKVMRGGTSHMPKNQKRKPGSSDADRTLGSNQRQYKRLRTLDSTTTDMSQQQDIQSHGDEYEHVKSGDDQSVTDAQTLDVATDQQQSEPQAVPSRDMEEEEGGEDGDEDVKMRADSQEEAERLEELQGATMMGEPMNEGAEEEEGDGGVQDNGGTVDIAGERLKTMTVGRGHETTIHTMDLTDLDDDVEGADLDVDEMRQEMEHQLSLWQQTRQQEQETSELWLKYETITRPLSQQLCEQLRLVLEPTQAAKLRGDYRTGKRLNMRKVIAYIASQFRKDKIWLRRTKPSRRQYQVMLAIDDSSSMMDNHSKQLAFESLAMISNALTLLEVGQLAICSFGESVKLLHPFTEQFSNQSGAMILQQFSFEQKRTKIAQLVKHATAVMMDARSRTPGLTGHPETSQLLLMVSDGRGLFNEGMETVRRAVREARAAGVFLVFVVIDDPSNKDSILDIKVPIFKQAGQPPDIRPYLDHFPFPFYIILRDINSLPSTLSDALRQWFELVTSSHS